MFNYLSASELLKEHGDYAKLKPISGKELKLVIPTNNPEETEKIEKYITEKYKFLRAKRVEKVARLCIAEWMPVENIALVTNQVSKIWSSLGTKVGNRLIIDPFEVMYLMESNQLELMYKNVSMSIEQARALISKNQLHFIDEYRIYAQLRRYGYIILKHDPNRIQCEEKFNKEDTGLSNNEECQIDRQIIEEEKKSNLDMPVEGTSKKAKLSKWQQYKDSIRTTRKRKLGENVIVEDINFKKTNCSMSDGKALLLKNSKKYLSIQDIYKTICIIKDQTTCEFCHNPSNVQFALDLYKPSSKFKKSSLISPCFRVIILKTMDHEMPCVMCLTRKKLLLGDDVPIIIARAGFDNISYFLFCSLDAING